MDRTPWNTLRTSSTYLQASTLSARSCTFMMGVCGPLRASTSSSVCRPTSRKSPASFANCSGKQHSHSNTNRVCVVQDEGDDRIRCRQSNDWHSCLFMCATCWPDYSTAGWRGRVVSWHTADMARAMRQGGRIKTHPQDLHMSCMEDVESAINVHNG
jgi:hypothetical protein